MEKNKSQSLISKKSKVRVFVGLFVFQEQNTGLHQILITIQLRSARSQSVHQSIFYMYELILIYCLSRKNLRIMHLSVCFKGFLLLNIED